MTSKFWSNILLSSSLLLTLTQPLQAHPAMFSDYSLAEAKAQAKSAQRLVLVDFTASWCPPCHRMDITTWSDPQVQKWVEQNAIAVQIDVDRERDIAMGARVAAMPTIIVFAANSYEKEFDRQVGYKTAGELLAWLEAVKSGNTAQSSLESDATKAIGKGGRTEVQARYRLARQLLNSAKFPEALDQYVWLWANIPTQDPPMVGVRGSYMAAEMHSLVAYYPEAKTRFEALRTDAEKSENRADWIELNEILNDQDKTLAWFDSVKTQPGEDKVLSRLDFMLERLLIKNNRWSDMGKYVYKDPQKKLADLQEVAKQMKEFYKNEGAHVAQRQGEYDPFPESVGKLYAALLAAGRDADADKVATESLRLQDSAMLRENLVVQAKMAGQSRPVHLKWLKDMPPSMVTDRDGYWARGSAYEDLKQYQLALKDYDEAIRKGPAHAELYYERSLVYDKLGKTELAAKDREMVRQLGGHIPDEPKSGTGK